MAYRREDVQGQRIDEFLSSQLLASAAVQPRTAAAADGGGSSSSLALATATPTTRPAGGGTAVAGGSGEVSEHAERRQLPTADAAGSGGSPTGSGSNSSTKVQEVGRAPPQTCRQPPCAGFAACDMRCRPLPPQKHRRRPHAAALTCAACRAPAVPVRVLAGAHPGSGRGALRVF